MGGGARRRPSVYLTPSIEMNCSALFRLPRIAVALVSAVSAACGSQQTPPTRDGHAVVLADSVVLDETDSTFVGEPTGFAVLHDGRFWISDRRNGVLHVYSPEGRRLTGIGRRGEGPNEWSMGPTVIVTGHDSLIIVGDGPRLRALDPETGSFRWERLKQARHIATAAKGSRLYLNNVRRDRESTIDSYAGPSDSAVVGGPYPELLSKNALVGDFFSFLAIGFAGGDSMVIGVQSSNYLFVGRFPDGPFDSVLVAPIRRRGAMPELLQRVDAKNPASGQAAMYKPSYPWAIRVLPASGIVASVTSDLEMVSGRMTGRLFVSFVDLANRRACSDVPIDAPTDPLPWVSFRADTLFVLTQEVRSDSSYSVIRKFALRPSECIWVQSDEH